MHRSKHEHEQKMADDGPKELSIDPTNWRILHGTRTHKFHWPTSTRHTQFGEDAVVQVAELTYE